jgi:hypothetical protein
MKLYGDMEVQLQEILISAQDGCDWQSSHVCGVTSGGKNRDNHLIGER